MPRHFCRVFVFALFAVAGFAVPTRAVTLPVAEGFAFANSFDGINVNASPSTSQTVPGTVSAPDASATVFGGDGLVAPLVYSQGTSPCVRCFGVSLAQELYYFQIAGAPNVQVPVDVQAQLQASGLRNSLNPAADAQLQISSRYGPITGIDNGFGILTDLRNSELSFEACSGGVGNCAGSSTVVRPINAQNLLPTNTAIAVFLNALAESDLGVGKAAASVDPFFSLIRRFLADNPGFSLEFSEGVDNSPIAATPLPSALPMFGAALIGLGAFAWRWRQRSCVAAPVYESDSVT